MACDSSSGFWSGALHISLHIRKTQPRGWRKITNEQTRVWVSPKGKKGEVFVTVLHGSPCICRLSRACILRETSTKPLGVLNHSSLVNPASVGQQVLAVVFLTLVDSLRCHASIFSLPSSADCVFSRQLSQADGSLWPSVVNWLSLSSLGPSFRPPFPVSREISPAGILCGFRAKADKDILWPAPPQTEMNATYCATNLGTLLKSFKYCYLTLLTLFNITHLFSHS